MCAEVYAAIELLRNMLWFFVWLGDWDTAAVFSELVLLYLNWAQAWC